jgi:hypothetical protein
MVASSLVLLPRDILSSVANYLLSTTNQNKRYFRLSHDWSSFLNTSLEHFQQWKRQSQIIVLSLPDAVTFYTSISFRERIFQLIENPRLQLDLMFSCEDQFFYPSHQYVKVDLKQFDNKVRKVHFDGIGEYQEIIPFPGLTADEIYLSDYSVSDMSYWSNIKNITFTCRNENFKKLIFDLSPLVNTEHGTFRFPRCVNYHCLANLKSLEIVDCDSITDVQCFQNIPVLTLRRCPGITDVSSLGKATKLNLSYCKNLIDVSALGNVHTLDLSFCDKVTDVSALSGVHTLKLNGFNGTDLSGLKSVKDLDICGAQFISNVSVLSSVEVLNIENCPNIVDISGLSSLKELILDDIERRRITTGTEIYRQLVTLNFSSIYDCLSNARLNDFLQSLGPGLRGLSLAFHGALVDLPFLSNLRSLHIFACGELRSLPVLPRLGHLTIAECRNFETLDIPGDDNCKYPLYELNLTQCENLKNIQIDRKISKCKLIECYELEMIEVNEPVGLLQTDSCCLIRIINRSKIVNLDLSQVQNVKTILKEDTDELWFEYEKEEDDDGSKEEEDEEDEEDGDGDYASDTEEDDRDDEEDVGIIKKKLIVNVISFYKEMAKKKVKSV